ncbi:MAG: hypothetical protein A4E19_03520 [Nitrospira sp. SG-bin1]|nr:MAG: hypothetical protein A4E19_03520 [Nitrospira sp. SG-bin1]
MQTTISRSLFHSRIAGRILGLFILCALVPTSILGWVSYRQVTEQLLIQTSARLKQESKSQGMVLYSHLQTLTADLDRIASQLPQTGVVLEDTNITDSVKEFGQRFLEIHLSSSDPIHRHLTQAQIAHLRAGKVLLEIQPVPGRVPRLTLTRTINQDRWETGLLSAHINEASLWSTQVKDSLPGDTDLIVEDGHRQTLYSTFHRPVTLPDLRRHDEAAPMGEGTIWRFGGQEYVAGAWTMPLRHTFWVDPWVIVLSQTRESALAPVEQFRHTFLLVIASALGAVFLLSLSQIRRSLEPVALLQQSTARLASGDFSTRVTVASQDEFQELAHSFNSMTDKLSQQFHMLDTISAISQAILSSHEPAAMFKIMQSRITETIACDAVGMTVMDPEHAGPAELWVQVFDAQSDGGLKTFQCRFSDEQLIAMKTHPHYLIAMASALPPYLTPLLKLELSFFVTFPIIVNEVVSGALILAYRQRQKPPADHLTHARRLADQVAVALAKNQAIKAHVRAQVELVGAVDARQQAEERATMLQATNQSLRTKEERLRHQQSAILNLVQDRTVFEGSLPTTAKQVTIIAARALVVDRVSVWVFEEHTRALYCLDHYDRRTNHHTFGGKLVGTEYPGYFESLNQGHLITAAQGQQGSPFRELVSDMVAPQDIGVRMDVPFKAQGKLAGVVSIEQVDSPRDWAPDERQFAQALANFMTLVLEAARRRESEEALALAKLAAEDATKAKAEFLANMSHEIRTPMNGVIGMTELLARTPLSEMQRHYVETIYNSGDTLLTLINDILDFSKIEAGKLDIQSVPMSLRDIVERTVEQLAERAQRKGLCLSTEYEPSVPTAVMGDPVRIRQILTNLLGNAIKFTQAGDVGVQVTMDPQAPMENGIAAITFAVTDTGTGISPEGQAKLFQSFSQVDGSSTRVHGGTGLGLSICKQLSELMGGTISVESIIGQGSTFRVVLPLPLQANATSVAPTNSTLADLRVCAAISHPATRRLVARYLSHWRVVSRMADTEAEFLESVMTELAIDDRRVVALIDETFADTTDTQLLKALASDSALSSARILRLVSFIRRADVEQDPSLESIPVVTKPLRYEAFRDAFVNLITPKPVESPQTRLVETAPTLSGHVLLAEDNPVNQEIALLMLKTLGCSVTVVQNGRQMIAHAQTTPYDLILMDCQMPEMDGFEATRVIREWEQSHSKAARPIIALTAHATPGDREQCLASGMNDYISKPFSMEHLKTVLISWLPPTAAVKNVERLVSNRSGTIAAPTLPEAEPEPHADLIVDQNAWESITSLQKPGKEDALAKILSLYLADSQDLVNTVRQGIVTGEADAVNQAAHSLKSRSSMLGAVSLSRLCRQVEELSRQGQLKEAELLLDQLVAAFNHANQVFRTELKRRAA